MYKTEEELKLESEANKFCYMNRIIDNLKVKQQNGRLWTPYHDMQLYEYVIKYKFNFYEISNAFQKLCTNDKKYEYSEDAVRLHWAFLHAMRNFDQTPDEAYYQRMKLQYDKEKPKTFKNTVEEREKMLSEEEEIKRMKEEFEKMMKEKEEKEKKMKEDKEKKEKERIEKEKKEDEEVEELISTTTKRREEENEENKDNKEKENEEKNNEDKEKENKENKEKEEDKKNNNDNKLYDENNEPEFIKQLFSKKIPQEILDKLNKDKEKYNNINNNSEEIKNDTSNEPKIKEEQKNSENINSINIKEENKSLSNEINTNLNINQEISKKEEKNNIINDEEEDLFPIKSQKQKENAEPNKKENINMEKELRNTQDFNDYIESNPELKKQYEQLNNYCNFAVKSLNYIVNKGAGVVNIPDSEAKKIEEANQKLNEFLLEPIIRKTEEKGLTLEDWNKKIEEEERKMSFETTNYDNYMKNAPKDEERDLKLNKFKEHLFGFAEQISTEELLEKITGIISQTNIVDNNNNNQENNNQINNNIINNNVNNNANNINLENAIQNFMNNIENNNNNNEDEKSENTKEQSESVNENAVEDSGRNTISSVGSLEFPKKYRHVYRGMVYYSDKPDEKTKNKNNNRNNKKKKDEDDEIEEDDDEDDENEYNK